MIVDLREFWTDAHKRNDIRWVSGSDPAVVLLRFGIKLDEFDSVLDVGPGQRILADHLSSLGKRVVLHDLVQLDDPRFVAELPLETPVDIAIAHLVFQHVPDHRALMLKILDSLKPGGCLYFDAATDDVGNNLGLAREFDEGTSFPFTAWDLVTDARQIDTGYFACVSRRSP